MSRLRRVSYFFVHTCIRWLNVSVDNPLVIPVLQTSTSEIYADPTIYPQNEDYRGNVNRTGMRSCYDEVKRSAETLLFDYHNDIRA